MRILQINNKVVNPPVDGGARLVLNHTLGLLALGHEVRFLAVNASRNRVDPSDMPPGYVQQVGLATLDLDTRLKPLPALSALLRGKSYHVTRFDSPRFESLLRDALRQYRFDVVELTHAFMGGYVPFLKGLTSSPIVLKAQNVEYRIWEKLHQHERNPLRKAYLNAATQALKRFETDLLQQVDGVLPLTTTDAECFVQMGCTKPMQVIPMGWDFSASEPWYRDNANGEVVPYHLAAMDWQPNEEAMAWFLRDIWPLIHARFPSHVFHCAGRRMPAWVADSAFPNVRVSGEVTTPHQWASDKNVMIVPLLSGSGIRAKILEAMALGKLVISTPLGADGINGRHGEHFLLASSPQEFADAYAWCVSHPEERRRIALAGRRLMQERYGMEACARTATQFYQKLLEARP